jgi:hypothetical protein
MYEGYIYDLEDRIQALKTTRPSGTFTQQNIVDAIARNNAALQSAQNLYDNA